MPSNSSSFEPIHSNVHAKNDRDDEDSFNSYFRQSRLPHPDNWLNGSPVIITTSIRAKDVQFQSGMNNCEGCKSVLPLNGKPVTFTGPLFEGKMISRIRDVPEARCSNKSTHQRDYFKGKSRQFNWTVQGTFSKRMRFDELVTGQDFGRPFRNAPADGLVKKGLALLKHRLPETFTW